jgi:hypothetical protein
MTGALTAACRYRSDWPELRITSGESAGDFFVRIVTFDSSIERCRAFVRTGETARLSLRDGSYEVRYASGPRWYGENQLFGEETELLKGTDPITLRVISMSGGYQLQGGELILEKQIGGNFPDQAISPTEFFE